LPCKPDWNIGYTTREHLCLDLDNTSVTKVFNLIDMLMQNYPQLGNALVLESSSGKLCEKWNYLVSGFLEFHVKRSNYHIIFNNYVGYEFCCHVIETLAELGVINKEYIRIREMRNDMTIRVSQTVNVEGVKQKPRIICLIINPFCEQKTAGIYRFLRLFKLCL